jgi:hypothetical protein
MAYCLNTEANVIETFMLEKLHIHFSRVDIKISFYNDFRNISPNHPCFCCRFSNEVEGGVVASACFDATDVPHQVAGFSIRLCAHLLLNALSEIVQG